MKNVVKYLEKSKEKFPKKIAVIEDTKRITYEELEVLSKSVGTYLIDAINKCEPVLIFMDKGIDALISFFGTVYANGFYSLVNPDLPETRTISIAKTLNAQVLITNETYYDKAVCLFKDINILKIEDLIKTKIDLEKLKKRYERALDIDPVYCNFTSGSTGIPKGVLISSSSIIDFIDEFTNKFNINENDIIANQAPFDFDVSVKDIYSSISVGATLLIVPRPLFSNPTKLLDYLDDNKATTLIWAVSALCLITTFHGLDYKVPKCVNKVIFSGEVMPKKHLDLWMEKLPLAEFINVYGPTEITCNCTYYKIKRDKDYDEIPIGVPFRNEKVFLLDENDLEVTDDNIVGEICVSGTCLSLGYLNNEEETLKHFTQNPLNKKYHERIYRTGDLGFKRDGLFYFRGRKDFQIKHMGHRIELEEIDAKINSIESIVRGITLYDEAKCRLYSFYIGDLEEMKVREILKRDLPIYMIPTKIIKVDELPLTKNGKIDRKKLLDDLEAA